MIKLIVKVLYVTIWILQDPSVLHWGHYIVVRVYFAMITDWLYNNVLFPQLLRNDVTLDHKTSHKGQFFLNWDLNIIWKLNKYTFHWCMGCYDRAIFGRDTTICKSGIWGWKKNRNIEKIAFKVVQIKFLAMHITNQKIKFWYIYSKKFNIFMEHDLY